MIALEDINDTSRIRQQIQKINRETLLKYKNYSHLTFPAEVICTIKKLKIKKSFRRGRGKGKRRTWDMNKGIHFNVLRLLPMKTIYKDTKNLVIALQIVGQLIRRPQNCWWHYIRNTMIYVS